MAKRNANSRRRFAREGKVEVRIEAKRIEHELSNFRPVDAVEDGPFLLDSGVEGVEKKKSFRKKKAVQPKLWFKRILDTGNHVKPVFVKPGRSTQQVRQYEKNKVPSKKSATARERTLKKAGRARLTAQKLQDGWKPRKVRDEEAKFYVPGGRSDKLKRSTYIPASELINPIAPIVTRKSKGAVESKHTVNSSAALSGLSINPEREEHAKAMGNILGELQWDRKILDSILSSLNKRDEDAVGGLADAVMNLDGTETIITTAPLHLIGKGETPGDAIDTSTRADRKTKTHRNKERKSRDESRRIVAKKASKQAYRDAQVIVDAINAAKKTAKNQGELSSLLKEKLYRVRVRKAAKATPSGMISVAHGVHLGGAKKRVKRSPDSGLLLTEELGKGLLNTVRNQNALGNAVQMLEDQHKRLRRRVTHRSHRHKKENTKTFKLLRGRDADLPVKAIFGPN